MVYDERIYKISFRNIVNWCYSIKVEKYKDEIINITGCGENAIEYILKNYKDYNLKLFLGHYEIPLGVESKFKLNGKEYSNTNEV